MSQSEQDLTESLQEQVCIAMRQGLPLRIVGGGTKDFYGCPVLGQTLEIAGHSGIIAYEPGELVVTVRAGTRLAVLEEVLRAHGQMLGCEPPHFGAGATVGGMIATGLSGPRRPYAGSVRDYVLGLRCLTGDGAVQSFGGRVIKNVAGFDIGRAMVGALGTLGVILDVTLKVVPLPEAELSVQIDPAGADPVALMSRLGMQHGLSACCFADGLVLARFSGVERSVRAAITRHAATPWADGAQFWAALREHTHPFFGGPRPLWRLSLAAVAPPLAVPGDWLLDWGGAQRWLKTESSAGLVRAQAAAQGGHATAFRGHARDVPVFHPLHAPLQRLHDRLKAAFDPTSVFNRGRLLCPHCPDVAAG